MGSVFSQTSRMGRLTTVLGPDTLALMRLDGHESLNGLFDWQVDCLATTADINFDALIGTHATVTLLTLHGERPFDGIVTEARWLGAGENGYRYRLVLRPWLYLAGLRRNQRIFHNKTVVDILEELLAAYAPAGALRVDLAADYPELEYTVQYRESDLDFACRLMERHGISYHFQHADGAHTMVLTDLPYQHPSIGARPFLPYDGHHQEEIEHFWQWHPARRITTGAIRVTDYNFKTPNAAMEADHTGDAAYAQGQIESFDWPGGHPDLARGQVLARLRTDGERGQDRRYEAEGDIPALGAGCRVTLTGDLVPGGGTGFVCLTASHSYTSNSYGSGGVLSDGYAYTGRYVLMPDTAPMVPELKTPRADVKGPQTAVVVGEGEIDCDEYGRILVRFHWDLDAAHSMRCRVSQNWAGNGWGGMVIPRIGMEVVVEFLDGDPDQPLVTGCVYNGRMERPYPLPEHKTKSVFRTDTHNDAGFNELTFEDATQQEMISLHAQKDQTLRVLHNRAKRVDNDQIESVGGNKSIEVEGNHQEKINGSMNLSIGSSTGMALISGLAGLMSTSSQRMVNAANESGDMFSKAFTAGMTGLSVAGEVASLAVNGSFRSAGRHSEVAGREQVEAAEKVGKAVGMIMPISGVLNTIVEKAQSDTIGLARTEQIGILKNTYVGKVQNTVVGELQHLEVGQTQTTTVGKNMSITVGEDFTVTVGKSRLIMTKDGTIILRGVRIEMEAETHIKAEAKLIDLN